MRGLSRSRVEFRLRHRDPSGSSRPRRIPLRQRTARPVFPGTGDADVRRRATACYVALAPEGGSIAGCYTLAAGGVPLAEMPGPLAKRLPRCPSVPVARMGRLAVNEAFQGGRLGAALLWDAAARAARSEMIVFALVVDVKDDAAASFYGHHGFVGYGSSPRQLLLPLARLKPPAS